MALTRTTSNLQLGDAPGAINQAVAAIRKPIDTLTKAGKEVKKTEEAAAKKPAAKPAAKKPVNKTPAKKWNEYTTAHRDGLHLRPAQRATYLGANPAQRRAINNKRFGRV